MRRILSDLRRLGLRWPRRSADLLPQLAQRSDRTRLAVAAEISRARTGIDAVVAIQANHVGHEIADAGGGDIPGLAEAVRLVADHRLGDDLHDFFVDELAVAV